MSFITFVIGVGIGALLEKALGLSAWIVRAYKAARDWVSFRKP